MQLTERHFYGTLICAQAQESLQLMRGPLDKHTKLPPGGDLRLQLAIASLLMLAPDGLQGQVREWKSSEHISTRFSRDSLDGITARGRDIAAYDAAAWHGSDAVVALKPDYAAAPRYLARPRQQDGRWEVVFGRLSATSDSFVIAYRAEQMQAGDTVYAGSRVLPTVVDTGYYVRAARALVPAPTRTGYWPLGADVRYQITPDGRSLLAKRRLHNTVLEYGPPKPGVDRPAAGYHSAVLADEPEDTDVFLVLTRRPQVPEYIVSASYYFRIDTDGRITAYDRDTGAR
jgi:hypothetical protein